MLRNTSIKRKGLLVISLPVVMSVCFLGILHGICRSLDEAVAWTMHSQDVLRSIEAVSGGMVAMHGENLQLALLGSSETAVQLRERSVIVRDALDQLRSLTSDNPLRSRMASHYVDLAGRLLVELESTQAALRADNRAEGAARAAADDRKLQEVALVGDALRREERNVAVDRLYLTRQLGWERELTLIVGGLATSLLVLLVGWLLLRSMLRRMLVILANVHRLSEDREFLPPIPAADEIGQIDAATHDMIRALRAQRMDNDMFIYSVSHDLRSPLVNLQGFSKELARSASALRETLDAHAVPAELRTGVRRIVDEEMPEALHFIDLAVQRQARIIESLLSLSRAGRVEYHLGPVDMSSCAKHLVAAMRRSPRSRGVEFSISDLPPVEGDADALERLLDNLLNNAIKYLSPERPGRVEIGCRESSPEHVVLYVRDNGIGIAPENLERVFLPFSRFAGGEGEGVGLSLVRRVVDRHHGRVWVESQLGAGTTVVVSLPAAAMLSSAGST